MKEFDDLISVWKEQKENKLSVEQVLTSINTQRNKMAFKLSLAILAMLIAAMVMIAVWVFIDFKAFTTHLALTMLVGIVFIYSVIMFKNLLELKNSNKLLSPKEHIIQLKRIQKKQNVLNNVYMKIYFAVLLIGLLLYYYEILAPASFIYKVCTYTLTIAWLLFAQFYLGKKNVTKKNAELEEMINALEKIEKQF